MLRCSSVHIKAVPSAVVSPVIGKLTRTCMHATGKTLEEAQAIAVAMEKTDADRSINALEQQLALAREQRASLDAA